MNHVVHSKVMKPSEPDKKIIYLPWLHWNHLSHTDLSDIRATVESQQIL